MIVIRNNRNESDNPVAVRDVYGHQLYVDRDELEGRCGRPRQLRVVDRQGRRVYENWGGRGRHACMVPSMIHRDNVAGILCPDR